MQKINHQICDQRIFNIFKDMGEQDNANQATKDGTSSDSDSDAESELSMRDELLEKENCKPIKMFNNSYL